MSKPVLRVEGLSKRYRLGTIGYGSLQQDLQGWWARVRGKDDPNTRIGETSRLDARGDFWALRDVSFEIQQGDRVGVIGRNGAGKSTLLKLLSRVTSPSEGQIKIRGRIASLLEVGTGFHPELSGRENVFLNGAILGMKRREIQTKFDEIVSFAGVEQFIDTPVKRYSSGMYVRLAFSVAAHLDSEILIVDEVLAVGDAEFQKKCITKMREISTGQGRTVFFVTHSSGMLQQLCMSGIHLRDGRVVMHSGIDSVLESYEKSTKNEKGRITALEVDRNAQIEISVVKVNGLLERDLVVSADQTIDIEIVFRSTSPILATFEVYLKTKTGVNVGYYCPTLFGHATKELPAGTNSLRGQFRFPAELLAGTYLVDLIVSQPGVHGYATLHNAIELLYRGNLWEDGRVLSIDKSSFSFVLKEPT